MGECTGGVYKPRNPRESPLYQLVEDYYEIFERCYDERFEKQYGFWRPIVRQRLEKFLECGIPHSGFARVRCDDCGLEYILPHSCKCRCLCPSCNQRRALEFGEAVTGDIIDPTVPIRSSTFTLPKMLRVYFRFDHSLYPRLCQCAFETVKELFQAALGNKDVVPGMVIGIHTWGNFANPHPHLHGLISPGCFDKQGTFYLLPDELDEEKFEKLFAHKVLKMMRELDKITDEKMEMILSWHNSGFNVHFGDVIPPEDREHREKAARYLVKPPVSIAKMVYNCEEGKVIYGNLNGEKKVYEPLDFLALVASHIPGRGENRVLYYGFWSKKSRGVRKKNEDKSSEKELQIVEPTLSSKAYRKRWAALIQKIWGKDPLLCSTCGARMRIISFVEDHQVIRKILKHLNLWEIPQKERPPPKIPHDLCDDEDCEPSNSSGSAYYFLDVALGRN